MPLYYSTKQKTRAIVYGQYHLKGMSLSVISMHGWKEGMVSDKIHAGLMP
jgi:hypothetical protein